MVWGLTSWHSRVFENVRCFLLLSWNHEIGLYQEMKAGRIGGNGGGSVAERPCDETANFQNVVIFLKIAFWPLSRA